MARATRSQTIRGHLVAGGLVDLGLGETTQKAGPDGHDFDGFSTRQHVDENGTLVVIASAYGPNWVRTLAEITGRLESPHVKCTVISDAPELDDHEVLTRWATSEELQARKAAEEQRQAPLRKQLRAQQAVEDAEERRLELEAAGQSGLF
ncbi:hypothetical protein ACIP2Z_39300 [Streptomyces iakyrus]|uniref:Uncharacterized protein n=1 Tax=Streptomyces iakyrus TaxID=68219 RepID=A0ABW8FSF3_9ACTN